MPRVTFHVLEGADKGRVFRELTLPVTIGREEGNVLSRLVSMRRRRELPVTIGREEGNVLHLNDERVSRFHAKVQADSGEIILTDLESTNGTRVNGNVVQIRRLRAGDRVGVGRSLLLFGSDIDLARLQNLNLNAEAGERGADAEDIGDGQSLWHAVWVEMPSHVMPPRHREATDEELLDFITQLRERVERSHIRAALPAQQASQLRQRLLDPGSPQSQRLGRGFRRLIILDAAAGLDESRTFIVDRFLEHASAS